MEKTMVQTDFPLGMDCMDMQEKKGRRRRRTEVLLWFNSKQKIGMKHTWS